MYTNDIIEMEDYNFNHYIHHFDETDKGCIEYYAEGEEPQLVLDEIEELTWGNYYS